MLTLLPTDRLALLDDADDRAPAKLAKAFAASPGAGLLQLAAEESEEDLSTAEAAYWRGFAREFLTALCHAPERSRDFSEWEPTPEPDDAALIDWVLKAPPAPGMEYLTTAVLRALWGEMDAAAQAECAADPGGLEAFLRRRNPLWRLVGRVTFHLAENKRNAEYPFAFLATYTHRISAAAQLQYLPLGKALREYAGKQNTRAMQAILEPVQRAAERNDLARELLDSRRIFQALAWTPAEAARFIAGSAEFEESGVIVKVPDWWARGRPARAKVAVQVEAGDETKTTVGLSSLLSFNVGVAVEGEALTPEEVEMILNAPANLVSLRGKWIEVDREKLQSVLDLWRRAEREAEAAGGIGFLEGMRLLAGMPDLGGGIAAEALVEGGGDWAAVSAGGRLRDLLESIGSPKRDVKPGKALRATLRPYQQQGLAWLSLMADLRLGACLADDMGLGKTIQVIALLTRLREAAPGARATGAKAKAARRKREVGFAVGNG
ncbi:MAG: SNF2 helicase-associated domain-containing protein [Verrucomicrobiales bacterium]